MRQCRIILALLAFCLVLPLSGRGVQPAPGAPPPDTVSPPERSASQSDRILVRIEVTDAEGNPFRGAIRLAGISAKDAVRCTTNQYGLGFALLLTETDYAVSVGDFGQFATFATPDGSDADYTVELQLPPPRMAGRMAPQGYGLVIFSYVDSIGRPWPNQVLTARSAEGIQFTARTDARGRARLSVPLGDRYTFSVQAVQNFDTHTFTSYPPIQTAEITLEWGRYRPNTPSTPRPKRPMRRPDSIQHAAQHIRAAKTKRPKRAYTLPQRPFKPSPKVTKRVEQGVYWLREALRAQERADSSYRTASRMEVLRPFQRNTWDSAAVVVDVTCSMDAYVEQYLLWLSLAQHAIKPLGTAFFNDGDGKADDQKRVGLTGGIRFSTSDISQAVEIMLQSIAHGCSGAIEENDLEALLAAQARYPQAKRLVLVADNLSAVRDLELLPRLRKPVHVVLCGALEEEERMLAPHADYLTIAYATGGSVHTLEEDLPMLRMKLKDDILQLSQWQYRWLRGRFVRINR